MIKPLILFVIFIFSVGLPFQSWAQNKKINANTYSSEVDKLFTVKKVSVLPVSDNLGGIYSRPIEEHVIQYFETSHRWDYVKAYKLGPIYTPAELEENPNKVLEMSKYMKADALVSTKVSKGPKGISLTIALFLSKDGKIVTKKEIKNYKKFDIDEVKNRTTQLLASLMRKLPFDGLVLSRNNNLVTVNVGKDDGIVKNKVVSVVQIIKANRHPKFNFLISTEKEILGKIKLVKIEKTLSFGKIITEIESGAIQRNAKVVGLDFVEYSDDTLLSQKDSNSLGKRSDYRLSFGNNAAEWKPKKPPTFGQATAMIGLGSFRDNLAQATPLETKTAVYPSIHLNAELWINPRVSIHTNLKQGILTLSNPSGASPTELSMNLSAYDLSFGYNFRLSPDIYGPKVEFLFGYSSYNMFTDNVPTGFTSMNYSGAKFGLLGVFPVTLDRIWSAGVELNMFLGANLTETPGTSGASSKNTISQFKVFASRKLRSNLLLIGALDIELYSSKFSGTGTRVNPATSSSQRHTTFASGFVYMF